MSYKWSSCFSQIWQNYCNKTSLHGWKYLAEKRRTTLERIVWWIVHIIATSSAIYLFYIISENFWSAPTITTLDDTNYPIKNIPFPAVAICDINKISRKKATEFAKDRANFYNISWERMLRYTKYLGRLYDYDDENIEDLNEFNALLDSNENNTQFDYMSLINIMLNLTPQFTDTIVECTWKTEVVNCSDVFKFRRTMDGFCSTFNYEKSMDHVFLKSQADPNERKVDTTFLESPGPEVGLTVLVRSYVDDYFYPLTQMEGLKVFLYNFRDYPDITSGSLVESLIPLGYEVFLKIDPETVKAVDIIRSYTVKQRQCLFSDEGTTAFDSYQYSHSDCLSECKMKTILALCECVPFYLSISTKLSYSTQLCTIADIPCLNKYKEKWNTISPVKTGEKFERDFDKELYNSIDCSHCFHDCSYTKYNVLNEYTPLASTQNSLLKGYNISEVSLIHIYFDTEFTILYKTDLYYYWFDIISNFGGMCGVFIGFSLISIVELFYHFLFNFIVILIKTKNANVQKSIPNHKDSHNRKY